MKRRFWSLFLAACLLCLGSLSVVAAALTTEDEAARVISGGTIEVSSIHNSSTYGDRMIDGDTATMTQRWISKLGDQEPWLQLMLPDAYSIDTLVLYSGLNAPTDDATPGDEYAADTFVVEAMQGSEWVQVARVEGNIKYRCAVTFPAVKASAWQVRFIKGNNWPDEADNRARIFEIRMLQAK